MCIWTLKDIALETIIFSSKMSIWMLDIRNILKDLIKCSILFFCLFKENAKYVKQKRPPEMFLKNMCSYNFQNCTGKHLCFPKTQVVNWTFIRRSEDAQNVSWVSYVRSIYVLCLRGWSLVLIKLKTFSLITLLKRDSNRGVFL